MELEEKPAKRAARKSAKAAPAPEPEVEEAPVEPAAEISTEEELPTEQGENNATT